MARSLQSWPISDTRILGITGERVLPIGLGTHGHGHAFGGVDRDESLTVIDRVLRSVPEDAKVVIDTAPRYGHGAVESLLGEIIEDNAERLLIATKGGRHIDELRDNEKDFSRTFLRSDLERSLERLRVARVFLYQLHNPSLAEIRQGQIFATLEGFRDEGLIDWYGVSINTALEGHAVLDAQQRLELRGLASIQAIYSVLTKGDSADVFRRAAQQGIAVIAREVLVRGLLTPRSLRYEDARASAIAKIINLYGREQLELKRKALLQILDKAGLSLPSAAIGFCRSNPNVTLTLVGCNRISHLDEDWSDCGLLSDEAGELLSSLSDLKPVK